jgi:hypothetical protein
MSSDRAGSAANKATAPRVGRPSTYDPRYCEIIIEAGARGESEVGMAVACGVPRVTMRGWAKQHPEFSTALLMAKDLSQKWWEDAARSGHAQSVIGPTIWKHSVASRFREDYGERQIIDQTVRDGADVRSLTDEELETEIAEYERRRATLDEARADANRARQQARNE